MLILENFELRLERESHPKAMRALRFQSCAVWFSLLGKSFLKAAALKDVIFSSSKRPPAMFLGSSL